MQAPSGSRPKITVVIPTLNEARNLPHVLPLLPQGLHEVLVVDGHSVDNTVATARRLRPDVRVITQDRGGKRDALACGSAAATGDIIVMLDADGSVDPAEIPQFVDVLLGGVDFVKGTRFADRGADSGVTSSGRIANHVLSTLVNALCHTHYSDPCYGFSAFWRRHVPVLGLGEESAAKTDGTTRFSGGGFEVDTLINIRAAQAGLTVKEVASYGYPRIREVSSLNAVNDGLRILLAVLSEKYRPRRRRASTIAALMVLLGADLKLARRSFGKG